MPDYEALHTANIKKYSTEVRKAYLSTINSVIELAQPLSLNANGEFYFRNNSEVSEKVNVLLKELYSNVYGTTVLGMNTEWQVANDKNNALVGTLFGSKVADLPSKIKEVYFSTNTAAKRAFIYRKENGLNLSSRVWKNTRQLKTELELALEVGIGSGKSAANLSKDVRSYLNDPDKLFRRVQDQNGVLRLSKAAKTYNPGQGRYRSSYKNALRLTRNETNFSYEAAQGEKRKQQDFITGIEIRVSPGHKASDDKNGISCLSLQGKYPKNFDFTNYWHPNCRCQSFNILKTEEELDKDLDTMLGGGNPSNTANSSTYVNKSPKNYTDYKKDNNEKWKKYANYPRTFDKNK